MPMAAPSRWAARSGVAPSPSDTTGVASVTGRNSRYRSTRRGRGGSVVIAVSPPPGSRRPREPPRTRRRRAAPRRATAPWRPASRPRWSRGPRAIETRSPRTAAPAAAPPAPGPSKATRPTGVASTSTRLSTPSQRPKGESAGTAVGTTEASMAPSSARRAVAMRRRTRPSRARAATSSGGDAGDAGKARRPGRRAGTVADGGRVDPVAEREPGQDHELVERVQALDVRSRIGLGVAPGLGLGQDLRVLAALAGHGREHVVGGPVDDAAHPGDAVRGAGPARSARGAGSRRRPPPRSGTSHRTRARDAPAPGRSWPRCACSP